MNFNSLFFPAPSQHYSMTTHFGEMIYIPKDYRLLEDPVTGESKPQLNTQRILEKIAKHSTSPCKLNGGGTSINTSKLTTTSQHNIRGVRRLMSDHHNIETTDSALLFQLPSAEESGLLQDEERPYAMQGEPGGKTSVHYGQHAIRNKERSITDGGDKARPKLSNSQGSKERSPKKPVTGSFLDGAWAKPPRIGLPQSFINKKMTLRTFESDSEDLVANESEKPEDVLASPIQIDVGIKSQNGSMLRPQKPKMSQTIEAQRLRSELEEVKKDVAQRENSQQPKREGSTYQAEAKDVKHIPCLLIQKRQKANSKKREPSVVNLLRSHMADLAKTYQLHQANRDLPAPTATNMEMSPDKVLGVSAEGSRQRANQNHSTDGTSMQPSSFNNDKTKPTKIIVYFHGNAEDVGVSYELLVKMSITFKCSVLAVEYPGYGIYRTEDADAETLMINAQLVMQYLIEVQGYSEKDIILIGRSMGSGPACALAVQYSLVAALVLLSPYTSLKQAVKTLLGTLASLIVRERFENHKLIERVRCPTLIIHGQADEVIPESHAIQLHQNCGGPSKLIMPAGMTHNECEMAKDLVKPIEQFFLESNVLPTVTEGPIRKIKQIMAEPPEEIVAQATVKDRETLKQLLQQKNDEVRRVQPVQLESSEGMKTKQLQFQRNNFTNPGLGSKDSCYATDLQAYSTAEFPKAANNADKNLRGLEDANYSASMKILLSNDLLLENQSRQPSALILDKSLQEAQAQLAVRAEYTVFRGRAPGPRQSLGTGPSPGPRPRAHVQPNERNIFAVADGKANSGQGAIIVPQSSSSALDKQHVKRVRTISQMAAGGTRGAKMLKDQKISHMKSNSTNSSIIKTRGPNQGTTNANMTTMLDQSIDELKVQNHKTVSNQKSERAAKRQKLTLTMAAHGAAQHFNKRKDAAAMTMGNAYVERTQFSGKKSRKQRQYELNKKADGLVTPSTGTMNKRNSIQSGIQEKHFLVSQQQMEQPCFLNTPEQNMQKHINSPNLMMPNKIGSKPLSWYNELEGTYNMNVEETLQIDPTQVIGHLDLSNLQTLANIANLGDPETVIFTPRDNDMNCENVDEPDMRGIEENVTSKIDAMHEGRGRIRTSSEVFPDKSLIIRQVQSMSNTDDMRKALALSKSIDFRTHNQEQSKRYSQDQMDFPRQEQLIEEAVNRAKMATKSSEYVSMPAEPQPNFTGWQNMEVNMNHSLQKDAQNRKRQSMKAKIVTGSSTTKAKEQMPNSIFMQISPKDFIKNTQTPKKHGVKKKHSAIVVPSSIVTRQQNQISFFANSSNQQQNAPNGVYASQPNRTSDDRSKQLAKSQYSNTNLLGELSQSQPIHQMKQSQRGSKVQILEQGGQIGGGTTTGSRKSGGTQINNHRRSTNHQNLNYQYPSNSQACMIASSIKVGPEKKFKKVSNASASDPSTLIESSRQAHIIRQKSFQARMSQAKSKHKDLLSSLSQSRDFVAQTLNNSHVIAGSGTNGPNHLHQDSTRSATIKTVTIPLSKDGTISQKVIVTATGSVSKRQGTFNQGIADLKSNTTLAMTPRLSAGPTVKHSFSSQSQVMANKPAHMVLNTSGRVPGATGKQQNCQTSLQTSAARKMQNLPQPVGKKEDQQSAGAYNCSNSTVVSPLGQASVTGLVNKSTGTQLKSRHAYIRLNSKDLSMTQVLQQQKTVRSISKNSLRTDKSKNIGLSQMGYVTPQTTHNKKTVNLQR